MTAKFAIRADRRVRLFFGRGMADVSFAIFCRGPEYARTIVTDLEETISADFTQVGFYLDFDRRVALLFDSGVCWDAQHAKLTSRVLGAASRVAGVERLDLSPEEAPLVALVANATTFAGLVDALQQAPTTDSWAGWQLHWGDGDAFRAAVARPLRRAPT